MRRRGDTRGRRWKGHWGGGQSGTLGTKWSSTADWHNGSACHFIQRGEKTANFAQWQSFEKRMMRRRRRPTDINVMASDSTHTHPLWVMVPLYLIGRFNRWWLAIAPLLNRLARTKTKTKTKKTKTRYLLHLCPSWATQWSQGPKDFNLTPDFSEQGTFRSSEALTSGNCPLHLMLLRPLEGEHCWSVERDEAHYVTHWAGYHNCPEGLAVCQI